MHNTMRSQVQESESITQGEFSWFRNSLVSNPQNQQQLQQVELSHPQNPQPQQIYDCWNSTEDESFQEIFEGLSNIYQLDNILSDKKLFLANLDEIESDGRKTKSVGIVSTEPDPKQNEQSKRIRSTELHNKSEKISYERVSNQY
ncbi:hypothetical protein M0R45_021825 [Rubus argutus]|uniref:Uncharacterized protein n=1 Tax=Rubus argutus TaxID=59490 RepID=A0AAW1XE59_RUBAR